MENVHISGLCLCSSLKTLSGVQLKFYSDLLDTLNKIALSGVV